MRTTRRLLAILPALFFATGAGAQTVTEFTIPTVNSAPNGIAAGPDGNVWFTESADSANKIGRISPSGVVTEFPIPTAASEAFGITAGPDGNLWYADSGSDRIGKITPAGASHGYGAGISPASGPAGIAVGPDGNLWFTETDGNRIGKITPAGVVAEYPDLIVFVEVKGRGRVIGGPINCPAQPDQLPYRCKETIGSGTKLRLRASAARGYRFTGWRGACRGRRVCVLHPKAAVNVTAIFRKRRS